MEHAIRLFANGHMILSDIDTAHCKLKGQVPHFLQPWGFGWCHWPWTLLRRESQWSSFASHPHTPWEELLALVPRARGIWPCCRRLVTGEHPFHAHCLQIKINCWTKISKHQPTIVFLRILRFLPAKCVPKVDLWTLWTQQSTTQVQIILHPTDALVVRRSNCLHCIVNLIPCCIEGVFELTRLLMPLKPECHLSFFAQRDLRTSMRGLLDMPWVFLGVERLEDHCLQEMIQHQRHFSSSSNI